ncbi:MAG TPA: prolyl oligopeptidase family serine peptidase [Candidatus Limnocylindrales bacterium]|nr:prolyl oligopeptidase family serine peptidase [Candidatus Limnocylindrales bacterium]
MSKRILALGISLCVIFGSNALFAAKKQKPPLTLDAFFNSVSFPAIAVSPNGQNVVIETERADWATNRFRTDLWLYKTSDGTLTRLTQSGRDSAPQWSPDGRWIAFLRNRPKAKDAESKKGHKNAETQVYVISAHGGESFAATSARENVHAFSWSADSREIFFATREPWTKEQDAAYRKKWKDVIQYRAAERSDRIFAADFGAIAARNQADASENSTNVAVREIAATPYRVQQLTSSPDGQWLAFVTESISQREESPGDDGIYLIDLRAGAQKHAAAIPLLNHPQAFFSRIAWAQDSKHVFFSFLNGSVEGPYQDAQERVYWAAVDGKTATRCGPPGDGLACERWGSKFFGSMNGFAPLGSGGLLAAGRLGTEVQPYFERDPASSFVQRPGQAGTYEKLSAAAHSPRVAFVYSSQETPAEVYLAEGPDKMNEARRITSFNQQFTHYAMPRAKSFHWKADDGVTVEGMLIYPPGKFGEKNLPMFTLIHGGPEDADGNHFEADWYQWGDLAASDGWLVFEPNYRGSVGYGDAFALGIIPHIVSKPGKDILEGVDALVKDGTADPNHLTVGGYSYGGYMTNWLITQTTRFKAAVTGAGAVEHVANWGNDDTTFDDAYFLGGVPWKTEQNYNAEAAIWQIGKVRTPTHMVAGADDIRVYVGEDYLLERALHTMGVPSALLIFPGEGHSLAINPWHGKIKVREELKWLDKYGR